MGGEEMRKNVRDAKETRSAAAAAAAAAAAKWKKNNLEPGRGCAASSLEHLHIVAMHRGTVSKAN